MKKFIVLTCAALIVIPSFAQKKKKPKGEMKKAVLMTHADSLAYAYGIMSYENAKGAGLEIANYELVMQGIQDAQSNNLNMIVMDKDKSNAFINAEVKNIQAKKTAEARKAGEDFLIKNKTKPGVITTESGLQYEIIKEGNGASPDRNDKVRVHYHGTLVDGTVFDSSVERNKDIEFGLNQVISGWTEGLQYMKEGAKYRFYIPQNLGYGSRSQGKIPAFSTLIFEVELFEVKKVD
jgi:FKBP-type peptidyl-prolyl cis-trans isomerase FklB